MSFYQTIEMIAAMVSIASGLVLLAENLFQRPTTSTRSLTRRVTVWLFFTFCALLVFFACISITSQSTSANKTTSSQEIATAVLPMPTPTPAETNAPIAIPTPTPMVHNQLIWKGTGTNPDGSLSCQITIIFNNILSEGSISGHYHCSSQYSSFGGDSDFKGKITGNQVDFWFTDPKNPAHFQGTLVQSNSVESITGDYYNGSPKEVYGGTWEVTN